MDKFIIRSMLPLLVTLLVGTLAVPETAFANDEEIIERVVVRNRKHSVWNSLEISPTVGLSVVNRMTQQYNFQLGIGYNFTEQWGLDVRGGWALSDLTSVGTEARANREGKTDVEAVDEFQDLWRLQWQALLMPRWSPIYGKLNIVTELPIHFQAYLTAGGGAVGLMQESVVYCQTGGGPECSYLEEERQTFAVAAGLGLRFFVSEHIGLKLEFLDMMYPDQHRTGISDRDARAQQPGTKENLEGTVTSAGLTNVLFFNVGATLNF